jgi:hypothetical protein
LDGTALTEAKADCQKMKRAYRTSCLNNVRQISLAATIYAGENNDVLPGQQTGITSQTPTSGGFLGLGMCFQSKLIGDGRILYCPSFNARGKSTTFGSADYGPLLTTDSGGSIRSTYCWNPWAYTNDPTANNRLYPKLSNFPNSKTVLAMEILINQNPAATDTALNPDMVAHWKSKSVVVLFSDSSVKAVKYFPTFSRQLGIQAVATFIGRTALVPSLRR